MKIIGLSVFIKEDGSKKYSVCLIDSNGKKYIDTKKGLEEVERLPLMHYK